MGLSCLYSTKCPTSSGHSQEHYQELVELTVYKDPEVKRSKNSEWCKKHREQHNANQRKSHKLNPGKAREYRLRHRYGLTVEQWHKLYEHGCWLCGKPFTESDKPFVEHHHDSEEVRGLAHQQCNSVVGYAKDDASLLRTLADSLEAYFAAKTLPDEGA